MLWLDAEIKSIPSCNEDAISPQLAGKEEGRDEGEDLHGDEDEGDHQQDGPLDLEHVRHAASLRCARGDPISCARTTGRERRTARTAAAVRPMAPPAA